MGNDIDELVGDLLQGFLPTKPLPIAAATLTRAFGGIKDAARIVEV